MANIKIRYIGDRFNDLEKGAEFTGRLINVGHRVRGGRYWIKTYDEKLDRFAAAGYESMEDLEKDWEILGEAEPEPEPVMTEWKDVTLYHLGVKAPFLPGIEYIGSLRFVNGRPHLFVSYGDGARGFRYPSTNAMLIDWYICRFVRNEHGNANADLITGGAHEDIDNSRQAGRAE